MWSQSRRLKIIQKKGGLGPLPSYGKLHWVHPTQKDVSELFSHSRRCFDRADSVPFLLPSWYLCHPPHCEDMVSLKLTMEVTSCRRFHSMAKACTDLWDHEHLQVLYCLIPWNNLTKQNILKGIRTSCINYKFSKNKIRAEDPSSLDQCSDKN